MVNVKYVEAPPRAAAPVPQVTTVIGAAIVVMLLSTALLPAIAFASGQLNLTQAVVATVAILAVLGAAKWITGDGVIDDPEDKIEN